MLFSYTRQTLQGGEDRFNHLQMKRVSFQFSFMLLLWPKEDV